MRLIYFYIGTTAEFIRIAPLLKKLKKEKIRFRIIDSGQNKINYNVLEKYTGKVKPYISLPLKLNKSSAISFLKWSIECFVRSLFILNHEFKKVDRKKTFFIIYGDPVSTTIGALVAKLNNVKILHLESGDFSFNLREPFPEEICRNINVRLADVLFPPSDWAQSNILKFNKPSINTKYNLITESLLWTMRRPAKQIESLKNKKYYVLILHRQEHMYFNKDWSKRTILNVINNSPKNLTCVLFNHPLTTGLVDELRNEGKLNNGRTLVMPLLNYSQFLKLINNAKYLATDGATNQFEAYLMGTPCILLRDYTEQVEGLGENIVLYKSNVKILSRFLRKFSEYKRKPVVPTMLPSEIVIKYIKKHI